jgi:hypothetical protein
MGLNLKRDTKETSNFVQKRLDPGVKLVKINQITLEQAPWGNDDKQVKFWLEGPAVEGSFEGFKTYGDVVAKGLVAEAVFSSGNFSNMDNTNGYLNATDSLINNLNYIAEKAGVLEAFQNLDVNTVEDLVVQFSSLVKDKFVWMVLGGRESINSTGHTVVYPYIVGTNIKLDDNTKYRQVYCKHKDFATEVVVEDNGNEKLEGKNVVGPNAGTATYLDFRKDSTWYYKPLEISDADPDENTGMDPNVQTDISF